MFPSVTAVHLTVERVSVTSPVTVVASTLSVVIVDPTTVKSPTTPRTNDLPMRGNVEFVMVSMPTFPNTKLPDVEDRVVFVTVNVVTLPRMMSVRAVTLHPGCRVTIPTPPPNSAAVVLVLTTTACADVALSV
jgi:hypothetical protein